MNGTKVRWSYTFYTKGWLTPIPSRGRISMPRELGGTGYVAMLNTLSAWPSLGPNFYTDLKQQELSKDFNFADCRKAFEAHRYRTTKTWGWNGRDWSLRGGEQDNRYCE